MINKKIIELLEDREFISVATCDFDGRPNAAPKFLLKIEGNFIYLIDYTIGRTFTNLHSNPQASLSFVDTNTLVGYQINGRVEVIEAGSEYEAIAKELLQRQVDLSTKRIIEGVTKGKRHGNYELSIADTFVVFKVKIEEITEMGPSGMLRREKV
ncbi:MAG: pyridoxamine 5'-phosphate oxidase family protein [Candidatus Omnitrophica bacterium]|nr:pyridoxamine 5'-phosphate oxidase family protein [Candidatus Omnitrophota bacterium]